MSPKRIVLLFLCLLISTSAWAGPILIYRGTGKQVGKSAAFPSGPVSVYILIDPATKQVARLYYYTREGVKGEFDFSPSSFNRVQFTLDDGRSSVVYSAPLVLGGEPYVDTMRALRGNEVALKFSSTSLFPFPHPRTLTGFEFVATDSTPSSTELRFTVAYQQKRSIAANDENLSIVQVFTDLVEELKNKGFE